MTELCYDKIGADERDLPPLRSADAPTYWKLSMLMTSMMGDTTRVLSCREQQIMWGFADSTSIRKEMTSHISATMHS